MTSYDDVYEQICMKNLEPRVHTILATLDMHSDETTIAQMTRALHAFRRDELSQDKQMRNERVTMALGEMGIIVSLNQFPDDDPSYLIQYVLSYQDIRAVGPTIDIAQTDLIEKLLHK